MIPIRSSQVLASLTALSLVLIGCGGAPDAAAPAQPAWCSSVALADDNGLPGSRIGLLGVDADMGPIFAGTRSDEERIPVLIDIAREGSPFALELIVPFHPTERFAGGTLAVHLLDEHGRACDAMDLTVRSLGAPDAPGVSGAFGSFVDDLQAHVLRLSADDAIDPALLRGDIAALPVELIGLGLTQFMIDHPENPNSLRQVLDRGELETSKGTIEFDPTLLDLLAFGHDWSSLIAREVSVSPLAHVPRHCVGSTALSSSRQLDGCMRLQAFHEESFHSYGVVTALASLAAALAAITPLPGDEVAFALIGAAALVGALNDYTLSRVMPRRIASLDFDPSHDLFTTPEQVGSWSNVRLVVRDNDVSLATVVSEIIGAIPVGRVVNLIPKGYETAKAGAESLLNESSALLTDWLQTRLPDFAIAVRFEAMGPVDIMDYPESFESEVRADRVVEIRSHEDGTYVPVRPLEDGTAQIVLGLRSGYFNNALSYTNHSVAVESEPVVTYSGSFRIDAILDCPHAHASTLEYVAAGVVSVEANLSTGEALGTLQMTEEFGPTCFTHSGGVHTVNPPSEVSVVDGVVTVAVTQVDEARAFYFVASGNVSGPLFGTLDASYYFQGQNGNGSTGIVLERR